MSIAGDGDAQVSRGRGAGGAPAQTARPASFEEGLERLADLVARLEGGQIGLAESIAAYESGVAIVRSLHAELADVEQRVRMLTAAGTSASTEGETAAGVPGTGGRGAASRKARPATEDEPAKSAGNGRKRPSAGRMQKLPGMDDAENDV